MATYEMTDQQKLAIGFTVKDKDGKLIKDASKLPAGSTVSFVSSDTTIADPVTRPDGLNADVGSGEVGTADITSTLHIPASATLPDGLDVVDVSTFNVVNTEPGEATFTVGAPEQE